MPHCHGWRDVRRFEHDDSTCRERTMDLKGKVAFVTGGSGDIGSAIARALATAGADVAISYVGQLDVAAATVDALRAAGRRSLAVQLDQRDPAAITASVDGVVREVGRGDILGRHRA